jgi:hypothetical protein
VTEIYYLELLRASEGTLSRWSRLHLQSFVPTPVSRSVDVKQAVGRKTIAESLSQHDKTCCTDLTLWDKGRKKKKIEQQVYSVTCCWLYLVLAIENIHFTVYKADIIILEAKGENKLRGRRAGLTFPGRVLFQKLIERGACRSRYFIINWTFLHNPIYIRYLSTTAIYISFICWNNDVYLNSLYAKKALRHSLLFSIVNYDVIGQCFVKQVIYVYYVCSKTSIILIVWIVRDRRRNLHLFLWKL